MVSVIVPNFNHSKYLRQRIDSILTQCYQNFELILLDDCSNDQSAEILLSYHGHHRVSHVVINEQNSGSPFLQWKKGIELAKGDFIWIAESDDWAHPDFLSEMLTVLENDPTLSFAYCDSMLVRQGEKDQHFKDIRNELTKTTKWSSDYVKEGVEEIQENLLRYCTVNNASSVVFRRAVFQEVDVFDRKFRYIGDWYAYLKICLTGKIAYRSSVLNFYRSHEQNASLGISKDLNLTVEYFQLFDWAARNIKFVTARTIHQAFDFYVAETIFRYWSMKKVKVYRSLLLLNPKLFAHMIKRSVSRTTKNKVKAVSGQQIEQKTRRLYYGIRSASRLLKPPYWWMVDLQYLLGLKTTRQIPIIINNFNRLTYLQELIRFLEQCGLTRIIILDNNSSYPPLLNYYQETSVEVIFLNANLGHLALWKSGLYRKYRWDYFVYTDSDVVPIDECPRDFMKVLNRILRREISLDKLALGIKIDDLPDSFSLKKEVVAYEKRYWAERLRPSVFKAAVDTTFALYKPLSDLKNNETYTLAAARTDFPLLIRHCPWYLDSANPSEEEVFYMSTANRSSSIAKQNNGIEKIY